MHPTNFSIPQNKYLTGSWQQQRMSDYLLIPDSFIGQHRLNCRFMIETVTKLFVNGFGTSNIYFARYGGIQNSRYLSRSLYTYIPYPILPVLYIVEAGIGQDLRCPAALRSREKVQCITELGSSQLGTFQIIPIRLVDDDTVRHLHDAALDTLQLVARTGKLDKQEEIHH